MLQDYRHGSGASVSHSVPGLLIFLVALHKKGRIRLS